MSNCNSLKKLSTCIVMLYKKIVNILMGAILVFLIVMSFFSTSVMSGNEEEITEFVKDNIVLNLLFIIAVIVILTICMKFYEGSVLQKIEGIGVKKIRGVLLLGLFVICFVWLLMTRTEPRGDQQAIFQAVYFLHEGDYSWFEPGGYLEACSNQIGLVLFYYLVSLIFGFKNAIVYQLLNAIGAVAIYKKIGDICLDLGMAEQKVIWLNAISYVFFPIIMYTNFIYGNILGVALSIAAISWEIRFFKGRGTKYAFISGLAIILGTIIKMNCMIFLIAMIIYAVIKMIETRKKVYILFVLILIIALFLSASIPKAIARQITGEKLDQGITSLAFVVMGLQDGSRGSGWFNNYINESYEDSGYNTEIQKQMAIEEIKKSLELFKSDLKYTAKFFGKKLASEWNNPTFQCYWINQIADSEIVQGPIVRWINNDESVKIGYAFLDKFCALVLIGAFVCFANCRNELTLEQMIFATVFIGGFIFHIFWEAKAQYTLSYFILLFPYSITGYEIITNRIAKMIER